MITNTIQSLEYKKSFAPKKTQNPSFCAKIMPQSTMKRFREKMLNKADNIIISCHASPDDDTRCSVEVLGNWLKKMGKKVEIAVNSEKAKKLFIQESEHPVNKDQKADLLFCLDFNSKSKRPKSYINSFEQYYKKQIAGFDHHPRRKGDKMDGEFYVDKSARSCCGILFRFFDAMGEKLSEKDLTTLYCGMLSDFQKSKLVKIKAGKIIPTESLLQDKNSKEIYEKISNSITPESKTKVIKYLDVLSNLSEDEKTFQKKLFTDLKVSKDGKLAYVKIPPNDPLWLSLGGDTPRISTIMGDFRRRVINNIQEDGAFSESQKETLKNVKGAMIFYSGGSVYQMSVHTKCMKALSIISKAKKEWQIYLKKNSKNIEWQGGGHENRAGGRIFSLEENDIQAYVNAYLKAAEKVGEQKEKTSIIQKLKDVFK